VRRCTVVLPIAAAAAHQPPQQADAGRPGHQQAQVGPAHVLDLAPVVRSGKPPTTM